MKADTMQKLFIQQLKDLYSAEKQLVHALPKMAEAASSQALTRAFDKHLRETEVHVQRVEQIISKLGVSPGGHKCKAMEGLIEESKEVIGMKGDPNVLDAGLIAAAQRVEHYEIAAYGCTRRFAELLGEHEAVQLLQKTLDEEANADVKLTDIAEADIYTQLSSELLST